MTFKNKIIKELEKEAEESKQKETLDDENQREFTNGLLEAIDIVSRIKEDDFEEEENLVIAGVDFSEAIEQFNTIKIR